MHMRPKNIILEAPNRLDITEEERNKYATVFLGGTIDNGDSPNWQQELTDFYKDKDNGLILANPRRGDWDKDATEETLREQIKWELDMMESADLIIFNILPSSKSPITLMEIGLHVRRTDCRVVVFCAKDYYRYMNVKEVCDRYKVELVESNEQGYMTIPITDASIMAEIRTNNTTHT